MPTPSADFDLDSDDFDPLDENFDDSIPALPPISSAAAAFKLDPTQQAAIDACVKRLKSKSALREAILAGAAGTGKSTCAKEIEKAWGGPIVYMAPTGKAAIRIRQTSGRPAKTIHSSIYAQVQENSKCEPIFGELRAPEGVGPTTLIVVDEASMVSEELAKDLRNAIQPTGAAILWMGDHEQLPPVDGKWGVDLQNPTAKLTKVFRQKDGSPILDLATRIRFNGYSHTIGSFDRWDDTCHWEEMTLNQAADFACGEGDRVILTFTHRVRQAVNQRVRAIKGFSHEPLSIGERIMVSMNNQTLGLMNGEIGTVTQRRREAAYSNIVGTDVYTVSLLVDGHEKPVEVMVIPSIFNTVPTADRNERQVMKDLLTERVWSKAPEHDEQREKAVKAKLYTWKDLTNFRTAIAGKSSRLIQATWGYCLTVHKSQGSQWESVAFLDCGALASSGMNPDFVRRLAYTAVTRASQCLTVISLRRVG